jgi:DNA-directed RNA polymerase specialized sigma24 family protein
MTSYCDKYINFTDIEYIDAVLMGDNEAEACFREMFIDKPVLNIVSRKFPWLKTDVDDICQEIWKYFKEKDWRVLISFKNLSAQQANPPKLSSYIWGAVSNLIATYYMSKLGPILWPPIYYDDDEKIEQYKKRIIIDSISTDEGDDIDVIAPESERPDKKVEHKDVMERLEKLVDVLFREVLPKNGISKAGLSEREQGIVRLKCIARLPSKEVGSILGMMTGAVDTALSRAKKRVLDYFNDKELLGDVKEGLRDAED